MFSRNESLFRRVARVAMVLAILPAAACYHQVVETGKTDAVDDRTLFQIASVSKAFTAAALALLADEGKLGWDDRVIDHLPEFRMFDPWVTREFTIRDLLTHRSGLPLGAGDLLVFPEGNATREEIIHALRYLEPSSSFRAKFDYDNLLYIVAGEVVARVAGVSFEEFLEQRLLFPLGMTDCSASLERAAPKAQKATPHLLIDGELQTTEGGADGVIAAAGGVNCSARSMAAWMAFVLNKGLTDDGVQLISAAQFEQLLGPVTVLPPQGYLAEHAGSVRRAAVELAKDWRSDRSLRRLEAAIAAKLDPSTSFADELDYKLIASRIQQHLGSRKPGMIAFQRPEETMRSFYELATSPTTRRRLDELATSNAGLRALNEALKANPLPPFSETLHAECESIRSALRTVERHGVRGLAMLAEMGGEGAPTGRAMRGRDSRGLLPGCTSDVNNEVLERRNLAGVVTLDAVDRFYTDDARDSVLPDADEQSRQYLWVDSTDGFHAQVTFCCVIHDHEANLIHVGTDEHS